MASVYLDASFANACVTDRTDARSESRRQTSLEWWEAQRHFHELYVSQEVIRELSSPEFLKGDRLWH